MIEFKRNLVRVLVVDDEDSIRNVLALSLREEGWNIELAANGKLALEAFSKSPFHIVLSDIQMPEMSGIELLAAVKKKSPHVEFIVMTSNATLETAVQAIKLGAYDYLTKPFEDLSVVSKKLQQVSDKILLRQQNTELLKRLRKGTQDLKLLFEMVSELNGILDEGALRKTLVSWPTKLFQDLGLRCFWFENSGNWKVVEQASSPPVFTDQESFKSLEELRQKISTLKSAREVLLHYEGQQDRLFVFESPSSEIVDIFAHEVKICFEKVMRHQEVVSLANRDGLTRLYNHRYFQDRLRQEISTVKRQSADLSLILIDVDHFKRFNDTYGHPSGDQLLRELGVVFDQECSRRDSDIVARYGGEEFVFILPFTDYAGAMTKAERVREAVEKHSFLESSQPAKVTVSLGVATFPQHAVAPNSLLELADKALYEAKSQGRNRSVGFDSVKKGELKSASASPRATLGAVLDDLEKTVPETPPTVEVSPSAVEAQVEMPQTVPTAEIQPTVVQTPAAEVPTAQVEALAVKTLAPEKPKLKRKALGPQVDIEDLCVSIESAIDQSAKAEAEVQAVVFKTVDEIKDKEDKHGTGTEG